MPTEVQADNLSTGANRDVSMETPPCSPPHFSRKPSGSDANDGPPSLTDIVSRSLSLSPETSAHESPRIDVDVGAKPSTPTQPFSTPDRGGSGGDQQLAAPGGLVPGLPGGHSGVHGAPVSDLTPVISNNSGAYVDAPLTSGPTRPGLPGLPPDVGHPEGRSSCSSSSGPDIDEPLAIGLRLRRLPPRAGPPLAKRSGVEGAPAAAPPREPTGAPAGPPPMPLSGASSYPSGRDRPTMSPPAATTGTGPSRDASDECDGVAHLLGERLSMPSYSDDGSSVDTSGGGRAVARDDGATILGAGQSVFGSGADFEPAPIELTSDQRFFSFQGATQYRRRVASDAAGPPTRLEAIPSPSRRPPASPKKENGGRERQYQPSSRSQHGVKEMADADDLKAIFKAPRKKPGAAGKVVTPLASPMQLDGRPLPPSQEEDAGLARPYPVESQWSIPSIRLANHVNQTSSSGDNPMDSFASYANYSECTDDDESFYSFLEDDDASLSSRGSVDTSARRRRRISGVFQSQRKASAIVSPRVETSAVATSGSMNDAVVALPPALSRRAHTFDSEAPPPILGVDAAPAPADDAADDFARPRRHHSGRRRGGRRRRREGAATEWLRELQDRSQRGAAPGGGEFLIAEAASSKFLSANDADGSRERAAAGATSEEKTKALGMPHPLCRSSTVEPGPFVHRTLRAGAADVGGAGLGSGNSIALTSSGSGD